MAATDISRPSRRERPMMVVLDDFPCLCVASPALPSAVQKAFGPRRQERTHARTRLVLCGSVVIRPSSMWTTRG